MNMKEMNLTQKMFRNRFPRYVAGGLDFNDLERNLSNIETSDDWREGMKCFGDERKMLALKALEKGHTVTAGETFITSSLYYHFSQIGYFLDLNKKIEMSRLSRDTHQLSFDLITYPIKQFTIPFHGHHLCANFRVPIKPKPPIIILLPGVDSSKEEMFTFEEVFLKRGLATFSYEGPGQGATWEYLKMRNDYEESVSKAIDFIETLPDVNSNCIGIYGRSMGGYLGPKAASFDSRIKAVVSAGGIYNLSYWDELPINVKHNFRHAWGAKDFDEAAGYAAEISLSGYIEKIKCPFLIIHSKLDSTFPSAGAERMAAEAKCDKKLVIYPEGTHVCDNITYKYRPLVADWLVEKLS